MQHSRSAFGLSLCRTHGAHSAKHRNSSNAPKSRYAGSHSSARMSFTTKGMSALVAFALTFCTATPITMHVITAQAATTPVASATAFAGEVASPTVDANAYHMQSRLTAAQFAKRVEKLKTGSFYLKQSAGGRCTVASATMMLRRAAYLKGLDNWRDITESAVAKTAWVAAGLKFSFKAFGMKASHGSLKGSGASKKQQIIALLDKHPEGIVVYDQALPHAVVVTDYDPKTGTLYCADPAPSYAGKRIKMKDTWNGTSRGGQAAAVSHLSAYWTVS